MAKDEAIHGVRPEVADSLQQVLIPLDWGQRQRNRIGYPQLVPVGKVFLGYPGVPVNPYFRRGRPGTEGIGPVT